MIFKIFVNFDDWYHKLRNVIAPYCGIFRESIASILKRIARGS
jgi:hypothetical protein